MCMIWPFVGPNHAAAVISVWLLGPVRGFEDDVEPSPKTQRSMDLQKNTHFWEVPH